MKILTNYDFNQNQLINAVIQKLATSPANPVSGQMYYDTAKKRLFYFNGTKWVGSDALDAVMSGADIVEAINSSDSTISVDRLTQAVRDAIQKAHDTHTIEDVEGLSIELGKKLNSNEFYDEFGGFQTLLIGVIGEEYDIGQDPTFKEIIDVATSALEELNNKVDNSRVLTDVPANAEFTDTKTTINGKTGVISKADIVALGIPAQDTTYTTFTTTKDGLVPKTTSSNTTDYLRRDGTWASPPDTKYTLPTATSTILGGIKSGTDITIDAGGNVSVNDNSHNHTIANVTGLQGALDAKETPAGATAKASTAENNAKGYTDTKIAELVGSAPETLDTLHELAEALGSDPNFATTILGRLSEKTKKYVASVGDGTKTSFVLTHNLNTRDVNVMLRETAAPYAQVITDVEMTTVNTVTVKFAEAPASGEYTVTIIG